MAPSISAMTLGNWMKSPSSMGTPCSVWMNLSNRSGRPSLSPLWISPRGIGSHPPTPSAREKTAFRTFPLVWASPQYDPSMTRSWQSVTAPGPLSRARYTWFSGVGGVLSMLYSSLLLFSLYTNRPDLEGIAWEGSVVTTSRVCSDEENTDRWASTHLTSSCHWSGNIGIHNLS